jgi:hypothetical protein
VLPCGSGLPLHVAGLEHQLWRNGSERIAASYIPAPFTGLKTTGISRDDVGWCKGFLCPNMLAPILSTAPSSRYASPPTPHPPSRPPSPLHRPWQSAPARRRIPSAPP